MHAHAQVPGAKTGARLRSREPVGDQPQRVEAPVAGNQAQRARLTSGTPVWSGPPLARAALRRPGSALDPATRALMEQRFGQSFEHVRVHTGREAAASARALDAQAYAVGASIVFGAGRFAPGSPQGRGLLAHELAHVLQQTGASNEPDLTVDQLGDAAERNAEAMSLAAARGQHVPDVRRTARRIMRAARTFSLTFDDGPHAAALGGGKNLTENVLDTLKARSIKAGFFIQTGVSYRMANAVGRALVARMQADGHKIGVHTGGTADHELHTKAQAAGRLEGELQAGKAAIKAESGAEPTLVRPPTGAFNKAVEATYAKVGLTNLLWDIDVDQGKNMALADLKKRVEAGISSVQGAGWKTSTPSPTIVVLMHDIQKGTANNLDAIIDHIKATVTKLTGGKDSADFSAP